MLRYVRRVGLITVSAVLSVGVCAHVGHAQHDAPRSDAAWPARTGALGCPAPTWKEGPGERIVVIGDSLTREGRRPLTRYLQQAQWNPTVRCWGGTRLDWAIDMVKVAKRKGQLPESVVIALGTNDMRWIDRARTRDRMRALVEAIGPERRILWVDTYASGGDRFTTSKQRWFNREVRRLARERPQVRVAAWGEYARGEKVRFRDALHYDAAGERMWARFVADQVALQLRGSQ